MRTIGGEEENDPNYQFFRPGGLAFDSQGNIYVNDRGNFRIQKYSSDWQYITSIGSKGEGPGEFMSISSIAVDEMDRLIAADFQKRDFSIFSKDGKFLDSFRNEKYIMYPVPLPDNIYAVWFNENRFVQGAEIKKEESLITIIDEKGNKLSNFGKLREYEDNDMKRSGNGFSMTKDNENKLFLAFIYQNRIEKYNDKGRLLFSLDRILTYDEMDHIINVPMTFSNGQGSLIFINRFSTGIQVDGAGNIWSLTHFYQDDPEMARNKDYSYRDKKNVEFEVFNDRGILLGYLGRDLLERRAEFNINGDRLFIIDSIKMTINEYKIIEK